MTQKERETYRPREFTEGPQEGDKPNHTENIGRERERENREREQRERENQRQRQPEGTQSKTKIITEPKATRDQDHNNKDITLAYSLHLILSKPRLLKDV